jgi:hypothetical protein
MTRMFYDDPWKGNIVHREIFYLILYSVSTPNMDLLLTLLSKMRAMIEKFRHIWMTFVRSAPQLHSEL